MSSTAVQAVRSKPENLFAGDQTFYQQQVDGIVRRVAELFERSISANEDLKELFNRTVLQLGSDRQWISILNGESNPFDFGMRRHLDSFTPMKAAYFPYYQKICTLFQQNIPSFHRMDLDENDMGRWRILCTQEDFEKHFDRYQRIYDAACNPSVNKTPFTLNDFFICMNDPLALTRLYAQSPIEYFHYRISDVCVRFFPQAPRTYIWGSNNEDLRSTSYFSDGSISDIVILHQDAASIESSLQLCANDFATALRSDGNDVPQLMNAVAHLIYQFSHAMPFNRGSAAVSEWLEMSIYRLHGYRLISDSNKMVNLEALTSTLEEFMKNYASMIRLEILGQD